MLERGTVFFDLVLYIIGLPLVVGEVKTPVRDVFSCQEGAADFPGGNKHYWENHKAFSYKICFVLLRKVKLFTMEQLGLVIKNWLPGIALKIGKQFHKISEPS